FEISASDYIDSVTKDPVLRAVLAGSNPLYAGERGVTPLYVHALVVNTYIESAWKCVNGGAQIATLLARGIRSHGGEIHNYSRVKKIACEGNRAKHIELENGERVEAKMFISNIHPSETLDMLENSAIRPAYRHRIRDLRNTVSVFILNLVMNKN